MKQICFIAQDEDALRLGVESHHAHDYPRAFGELFQLLAALVKEIQVVITVLLTLHDELRVVPGQELDGVLGFYILVGGLAIELSHLGTCFCVIGYEPTIVLTTIQLKHIDGFAIGTPCDIREIAVDRATGLQINGLLGVQVIDAHRHLMAGHAGHRIFVGLVGGFTGEDVHLWIVCHHLLIHAIEGQLVAVRTPESAFVDAELVTMYGLSIYNLTTSIGR